MLIINADDWGRSRAETEAALRCHQAGTVTAVSAMVFMADSERAADLARAGGVDVGLHLNLSEPFSAPSTPQPVRSCQERVTRFLKRSRYAVVLYHPFLAKAFRDLYRAQAEEFARLYGRPPSHVDGHQHLHQCANMVLGNIIPRGQQVRRNFTFRSGEKSPWNRLYRRGVDGWLGRRYQLTDSFFCLSQSLRSQRLERVLELAKTTRVELMTHPIRSNELEWLLGEEGRRQLAGVPLGSFAAPAALRPELTPTAASAAAAKGLPQPGPSAA